MSLSLWTLRMTFQEAKTRYRRSAQELADVKASFWRTTDELADLPWWRVVMRARLRKRVSRLAIEVERSKMKTQATLSEALDIAYESDLEDQLSATISLHRSY